MDTSSNSKSQTEETPLAPTPQRRRLRKLWLLTGALALLVALTPTILSLGALRATVEAQLAERLRCDATVDAVSLGWLSGLEISGLRLGNPPGFPAERPAVVLERLTADISLSSLLFGAFSASGEIVGLDVSVEQQADGSTNLQQLILAERAEVTAAPASAEPAGAEPAASAAFALDIAMRDCAVIIRREGQVLESLTDFRCNARSASTSQEIDLDASGKLRAGDLAVMVKLNPGAETTDTKITAHGLDLATWKPLVDAFMPNQLTSLAGEVDGDITATTHRGDQIELAGELVIEGPHVAGPLLHGMDVASRRWTIKPALAMGSRAIARVDARDLDVDLEWLRIRGASPSADGRVAVSYDIDIAALAEFGGPLPATLKDSGTTLTGMLELPADELPTDINGWASAVTAAADLRILAMKVGGFSLRDLSLDLDARDGELQLRTAPGAELDGGALAIGVDVDLIDVGRLPASASIQWQGGKLTGGATESLRYIAPLLAGLDSEIADLRGRVDIDVQFAGPAAKAADQPWLAWLDAWSGRGSLGLRDTMFTPAQRIRGLLEPLGALNAKLTPTARAGQLRVDSLTAPFSIRAGQISTRNAKWLAGNKTIGLAGSVGLDGTIDYELDFASLLRGRKDGEKALRALGGELPGAKLSGSVSAPDLGLPDLGDLAERLLKQQRRQLLEEKATELLEGGIKNGLKSLFRRRKKKKR